MNMSHRNDTAQYQSYNPTTFYEPATPVETLPDSQPPPPPPKAVENAGHEARGNSVLENHGFDYAQGLNTHQSVPQTPQYPPRSSSYQVSNNYNSQQPQQIGTAPRQYYSPPQASIPSRYGQFEQQQTHQTQYQYQNHQEVATGVHFPEEGWLPETLHEKSKIDLRELAPPQTTDKDSSYPKTSSASPEDLFQALLQSSSTRHPILTSSNAQLEEQLQKNLQLAAHLNQMYQQLEAQRAQTSAHLMSLRALENQWKKKQAELERRLEPWGPRVLYQRLANAITEQEQICKGLENSFIEGEGENGGTMKSERETTEWIRQLREGRKLVALRRERRARWDEGRVGGWR